MKYFMLEHDDAVKSTPILMDWSDSIDQSPSFCSQKPLRIVYAIISFTQGDSYAEYPPICGLSDGEKQDAINNLLAEQIYVAPKALTGETFESFVGFSGEMIIETS